MTAQARASNFFVNISIFQIAVNLRSNIFLLSIYFWFLFSGEAREVHQICVLVGYGADAICPYMVFEIAQMLREENVIDVNDQTAYENYAAAVDRGISKVRIQIFVGKPRYFTFEIA